MSRDPVDRELTAALRERTTASSSFTTDVLARVEKRRGRANRYPRPALAVAAALLLFAVGATVGWRVRSASQGTPGITAERQELQREYLELQQELARIRQLAEESGPVLHLGGDETLDLLYDLRGYEEQIGAAQIQPASLPPDRG